jgi:RinA family phage transcriptional activator
MGKSWLSSKRIAAMDEELFDYRHIDKAIARRKLELSIKVPHENIGGGHTHNISDPTHDLVAKWDSDLEIRNLKLFKENVDALYSQLSDEQKVIFNMRWLEGGNTWEEIGDKIYCSRKSAYNKRDTILEKYAELTGKLSFK